jgi:hypothetical protein
MEGAPGIEVAETPEDAVAAALARSARRSLPPPRM